MFRFYHYFWPLYDSGTEELNVLKRIAMGVGLIWCFYSAFAHFGWVLPGPQSPPQLVLAFLANNHNATAVVSYWGIVTTLLFLVFGNTLLSVVSPQNCWPILQRVAQGGLLSYVVLTIASQSVMLSISYFFVVAPSTVLTATGYQMALALDPSMVLFLTLAVFIGAISWLALHHQSLPRWLSRSGLFVAVLLMVATGFILVGALAILVPAMEVVVPLWFAVVVIWFLTHQDQPDPKPEPGPDLPIEPEQILG